jgi:hypothetical protein
VIVFAGALHRDAELAGVRGHVASHAVARAGEADAKLNSHDIKVRDVASG